MTLRPVQWVAFGDGSTPTALYLWHVHHFGRRHRDNIGRVLYRRTKDDLKMVGVYSSREEVEAAVDRKRGFPGFGDEPDCFFVTAYPLDTNLWPTLTASCSRNRPAQPRRARSSRADRARSRALGGGTTVPPRRGVRELVGLSRDVVKSSRPTTNLVRYVTRCLHPLMNRHLRHRQVSPFPRVRRRACEKANVTKGGRWASDSSC